MTLQSRTVLVDENLPCQFAAQLRDAGVNVVDASASVLGASDEFLLAWAAREQWILISGDLDFPRMIFSERRAPPLALIVERRQPRAPGRLVDDVLRVLRLGEKLHGHVIVFDGGDERVRRFPAF